MMGKEIHFLNGKSKHVYNIPKLKIKHVYYIPCRTCSEATQADFSDLDMHSFQTKTVKPVLRGH